MKNDTLSEKWEEVKSMTIKTKLIADEEEEMKEATDEVENNFNGANEAFLPDDYKVPSSADGYMKFEQGENKFRILTSPILGYEYWVTEGNSRKPVRTPMDKPFNTQDIDDPETIKHFWAMVVYNYQAKRVQVLEITQKGIQKTLRALAKDVDWGSPVMKYDIVINKTGEKMETKYEVLPKPAKPIDEGIVAAFHDMHINLKALYDGGDPFAAE